MSSRRCLVACLIAMSVAFPTNSWAAVTWYFNWYCAGCSKIGARTTGTEGPFTSESSCESARSSMRSRYGSGDVNAMPCSSQGLPDTPRSSGSSSDRDTGSTGRYEYQAPAYDYEAERRERERQEAERQRSEEARRKAEEERQKQFIRERDTAVSNLKGGSSAPFGIKGNPDGDLQLKDPSSGQVARSIPTAWKQLHCASSLSINAIEAARRGTPDMEEVRFLGQEVVKALNGEKIGVECPPVPEPPAPFGSSRLEKSAMLKFYADMLREVEGQAMQIADLKKRVEAANARLSEAKAELQQLKSNLVPARVEIVDLPDYSELITSSQATGKAGADGLPDYSELFVLPVTQAPGKAGSANQKLIIGVPAMPQLPPGLLSVSGQLQRQTPLNLDAVHAYLATLSDQSIQRLNLARKALEDYWAKVNPDTKNRAQGLNDFWFAESLRRTREELYRKESIAYKNIWDSTVAKINEHRRRGRTLEKALETREEGERQLDGITERLMTEEETARRLAFERAQASMVEEYKAMQRNGLLRPGENLVERERREPEFRKAVAAAAKKADLIIDTEWRAASTRTESALAAETKRLQQQGLLPDLREIVSQEDKNDASARRLMAEHDAQIRAAHQRTIRELNSEFTRLKSMQPQMLKRAEVAIRETDKLIRDYQAKEAQADLALQGYQRAVQATLAKPEPASFATPK